MYETVEIEAWRIFLFFCCIAVVKLLRKKLNRASGVSGTRCATKLIVKWKIVKNRHDTGLKHICLMEYRCKVQKSALALTKD